MSELQDIVCPSCEIKLVVNFINNKEYVQCWSCKHEFNVEKKVNKYERNIQQIIDMGESAVMYFLDKTIEELSELRVELNIAKKEPIYVTNKENIYEDIANVLNCIEYLTMLFDLDRDKIDSIRKCELDRGYERGKND